MKEREYFVEVQQLAKNLVKEALEYADHDVEDAKEYIQEESLHEAIDGHQWIIYNGFNLSILQHSSNNEVMQDEMGEGELVEMLKRRGLSGLHQALAFWAMKADVQEYIDDAFEEY